MHSDHSAATGLSSQQRGKNISYQEYVYYAQAHYSLFLAYCAIPLCLKFVPIMLSVLLINAQTKN